MLSAEPRCGQSALPFPSLLIKGWAGSAGGAAHLSREAAGNGNYLGNNHSPGTGFCVFDRNVLTWRSLGAQGQCVLSCKF